MKYRVLCNMPPFNEKEKGTFLFIYICICINKLQKGTEKVMAVVQLWEKNRVDKGKIKKQDFCYFFFFSYQQMYKLGKYYT